MEELHAKGFKPTSSQPGSTHSSPRLLTKRSSYQQEMDIEPSYSSFQRPRKVVPMNNIIHKRTQSINTSNTYQVLTDTSDNEDIESEGARASQNKKRPNGNKRKRRRMLESEEQSQQSQYQQQTDKAQQQKNQTQQPTLNLQQKRDNSKYWRPPLVIEGTINNIPQLQYNLQNSCGINSSKVHIKYTKNNTILQTTNKSDYDAILNYFRQENNTNTYFHTYTPKETKTHAFVVRGLDNKPTEEMIVEAFMQEHEIELASVYQMNTKGRPLYLIVTSSSITLRYLNQNIRYLNNIRIFFEERRNTRPIIQCKRCQQWGHATSNCYRQVRCVRCAGSHATKECEEHHAGPITWKCANCGGDHQANNTDCPIYQQKTQNLQSKREDKRPIQYRDAPAPATNAWQRSTQNTVTTETVPDLPKYPQQLQQHNQQKRADIVGSRQTQNSTAPDLSHTQNTQQEQRTGTYPNNKINDILETQQLFTELDSLINIKEMNRAVRALIDQLKINSTPQGKFVVYYEFIKNLGTNFNV